MVCNRHRILFATSSQEELDGWACGTHGREEKCIKGFGGGNLSENTTWNT